MENVLIIDDSMLQAAQLKLQSLKVTLQLKPFV